MTFKTDGLIWRDFYENEKVKSVSEMSLVSDNCRGRVGGHMYKDGLKNHRGIMRQALVLICNIEN